MNKKITAILLIVCMMVSILPVFTVSAADTSSPFYKVIAEDALTTDGYDVTAETSFNTGVSGKNYGTGWSGVWSSDGGGAKFDGYGVFTGRPNSGTVRAVRQLNNEIDFSKEGVYTFTVELRDGSSETQDFRFELGNTGIVFGTVVPETNSYWMPQIKAPGLNNGNMVIYDGETSTSLIKDNIKSMFIVCQITVTDDGLDTLKIKAYGEGKTDPGFLMTQTAEISNLNASFISTGFNPTTYSKTNGVSRLRNIKIEYDNPNAMTTIYAAKEASATLTDVEKAFSLLADYTGADKDTLIADVKANATTKGFDVAPKIVSATPNIKGTVKANDFGDTITINYSYPLVNAGTVSIKQGETVVAELASISGKTVTLNKVADFDNDTPYVLTVDGVVDFKGDAIENYEFRTAVDTEVHASAFSKLYAEDTLHKTAYCTEEEINAVSTKEPPIPAAFEGKNKGTGWSGTWTGESGGKLDSNGAFVGRPTSVPSVRISRNLAETIDFSKDGIYTFTLELRDNSVETQSAVMELGASGIKFGAVVKDATAKVFYPQLQIPGGTMEINNTSTATGMNSIKSIFTVLTVTVQDGADKLEVITYLEGSAVPAAMITKNVELSGKTASYISVGYDQTTYSRPNGISRIRSVKAEYENPTGQAAVEAGMSADASLEEVKAAFSALLTYDAANKQYLVDAVKAVAEAKGYDLRPELISATPDFVTTGTVNAQDFGSTFTLSYSYPLEGTGTVYLKQGDNTIAQSTKIEGNTVTMSKFGIINPGKFYDVVSEDVKDFKGDIINPYQFGTYVIPTINVADNAVYDIEKTITWEETDGMTVVAKLTSYAEGTPNVPIENNTRLTVAGNYRLKITASMEGIAPHTEQYDFEILPDVAPVATDIKVELDATSSAVATGATVKGSYKFKDDNECDQENKDEVTGTSFQWYRVVNGDKVAIEGATGKKYTLTEADDNHNIVFGVTPKSTSVNNPGTTEFYSDPFIGAYAPTATTVTVDTSNLKINSSLIAEIDYADLNGDAAGVHKVRWFMFGDEGDVEITENVTDGKLTVTNAIVGKYLYAIVTPVSSKAPYDGNQVISGEVYVALAEGSTGGDGEEEETSDFAQFSADLLMDDVNLYPLTESADMTDHRAKIPVIAYSDNSVGFATNWSTEKDRYVPTGTSTSNCFQNSATWGGWGISYSASAPLYRALLNKIDMSQTGTYTFVTEIFDYNSSGSLTGTDFRMYIGTENWYYGYKAPGGAYVPTLGIGNNVFESDDTIAYTGTKTAFIKAQIDVKDGQDTFRVKMWEGATEPEGWNIEQSGEIGNLKVAYIGFTPNPATTNGQRYVSFKASFDNVALKEEIMSVAGNASATEEEIHNALAALSTYEGADKEMLIGALTTNAAGTSAATTKIVETSVSTTEKNVAHDIEKISFKYDFMLDPASAFVIKDKVSGDVVASTGVVNENKVTLNVTGEFVGGKTYVIDTTSATDYKGAPVPGFEFETMDIPSFNVSDGGLYSQNSSITWEGTATVTVTTPAGVTETATSPYVLAEVGTYSLTVAGGDTLTIEFTTEADVAPVAKNVTIRGFRETGKTLTASYTYYDANGDAESGTTYQWYRKSGDTVSEITGATSLTYTLTVADENCDLIFGVKVKSNSTDNPGGTTEEKSTAYAGAYAPVVKDLKVAVDPENEDVLYASYTYYDKNGDLADAPVITWHLADGTPITENIADGKLTITSALYEQTIVVRVQPYAQKAPVAGNVTESPAYLMPSAPVVTGLTISGLESATAGSVLTADYSFTDPNGDHQGLTTYEWKNTATNTVLSTTQTLTLTSDMSNATVQVTVTGMSEKIPYAAAPVTTTITIPYIYDTSFGGDYVYGGSGSGSTGGGGGGVVAPSTPVTPPQKVVFADVQTHWAKSYVTSLLEKGVVMEDENFRPDDSISRAELLAMLFRSAKTELSSYGESFGDVNKDDWFAGYVQTALDMGIVSSADNFRPNDAITREETAKIVANMLKLEASTDADFADKAAVSDWAISFVNAVYEAGIFKGDDNGNFNPKGSLTRAETATVIYRLLQADSFKVGGAE